MSRRGPRPILLCSQAHHEGPLYVILANLQCHRSLQEGSKPGSPAPMGAPAAGQQWGVLQGP
eukprot:scaffold167550_cov19-Tisochrysis_lutea.AAC.2